MTTHARHSHPDPHAHPAHFYPDSETLYKALKALFARIKKDAPEAYHDMATSHMALRLKLTRPAAEVWFDARQAARFSIHYGLLEIRPNLELDMTADTLHRLLLNTLTIRKAWSGGLLKVRGPMLRLFALSEVIEAGREFYPEVLKKQKLLKARE
jgi:hypothetical protein